MNGRTAKIMVGVMVWAACNAAAGFSQTRSTGAITGTTTDAMHAVIPGVAITITNEATREVRSTTSNEGGSYTLPLLAPGSYRLEAALPGFKTAVRSGIVVNVTETQRYDFQLEVGARTETVTVETEPTMVQGSTSALGRVVGEMVVANLPLSTRNFTQILALSPGISTDVTNASELGRGSGGQMVSRTTINGSRPYDHSFEIDGIDTTDFQSSQFGSSPGTAVPNPDAIEEFKVQTAQADASFGRNAGAHVNIITKSGTNDFHGTLFEFFRNEALNANDFFFNRAGRRKPIVRQNQFGGTFGGPIKREKLLFFGSYQGTHQINGLAAGKSNVTCSSTIFSPPLTNDRSAAALGALFGGQTGQNGGVAILPDGSNINPVALRLLQLKLPDGSYLFPTPQIIDRSQPFARQGFSAFSVPCTFHEEQFTANADYLQSDKSKFNGRFFSAISDQKISFGGFGANAPGSPITRPVNFWVASLAHTYIFGPHVFNEIRGGYSRSHVTQKINPAFRFSDIGVTAGAGFQDIYNVGITGSYNQQDGQPVEILQGVSVLEDHLSYIRGRHNLRFGGGIKHIRDDIGDSGIGTLNFLSFPDFLLGLNAASNGSSFSNIFASSYQAVAGPRWVREFDSSVFIQDDMKAARRLTLNLGFRYERLGQPSDAYGAAISFDAARANPNPPAGGTLQGWLIPSNYRGQVIPAGVTQLNNDFGIDGARQNTWAPRVGLAWQILPNSNRLVLRSGYGVYYTHPIGNLIVSTISGNQFRGTRSLNGASNANATFQNPFPQPIPTEFPQWTEYYSPTTALSVGSLAQGFRPAMTQQYSLNLQTEFARSFLLEVGYVGARGTHIARNRSLNEALLASPSNPIRGVTTNTLANVPLRVPIQGFQPTGIGVVEAAGSSWYNGLQTSLTKRFSKGLQFLASYTWSKSLDTDAASVFNSALVTTPAIGDQNNAKQHYGRTILDRPHRFVFSYVYELPNFSKQNGPTRQLVNGWSISGVATIQSGNALFIGLTNGTNVTGITSDRAQLAPGCTYGDLLTSGRLQDRLNKYFNTACLTRPPVVGSDGIATTFGNTGVGIFNGPGQYNLDMSIMKKFALGSAENKHLEFRGEFFNLLNTPQFNNPDTNFSSGTFGQISSTVVNPRFIQLALKLTF